MSTDLVLLTAQPPTADDLELAARQAVSSGHLTSVEVDGSWTDDPVVGVAGYLPAPGGSPLLLQVGRPRRVARAQVADLSADLYVTAPDDGGGSVWVTDLWVANPDDPDLLERQFRGVQAICALLAGARHGYLVITSGGPELVELEGVPAPEPLSLTDLPPRAEPVPPAAVFVGAFVPVAEDAVPAGTDASWRWTRQAVTTLCAEMADNVPDHVLTDEEWGPLTDAAPAWWPGQQSLFASRGRFGWTAAMGRGVASGTWVDVAGRGPAPDEPSRALGGGLVALARSTGLDYAYAHPWHPDEPWTGAVGPRLTADGPYFLLVPHQLEQGLPNLYWAQVLGPRWVARFGRDLIAATPAHRVEEIAPDHWYLQLAPSLSAVVGDFEEFQVARAKAVDHLGRDSFPFLPPV